MPSGRKPTIHFKTLSLEQRRAYLRRTSEKNRRKNGVMPRVQAKTVSEAACHLCGIVKPSTQEHFYIRKDGYFDRVCRPCTSARAKANLPLRWGLDPAAYKAAIVRGCTLCGSRHRLSVDHCHDKNKVRNILCTNCNHGLGNFKDNPTLLRLAAQYVEHYAAVHAAKP